MSEVEKAKITRRKYLTYGAGVVVVAVVAAAGYGIYEMTKPKAAPAEITNWTIAGPQWELSKHAAETYMAANPNGIVKVEQSDWTTFETTYAAKLSTAPPPDMCFQIPGPTFTYSVAEAGLLLELDKAAEKYGWDKFNPGYKNYVFNDHYYVMTHDSVGYPFIYYNPKIFDEVGVSEPKTLQELYDICDKVRDKGYLSCTFGVSTTPVWIHCLFTFIIANLIDPSRLSAFLDAYGQKLTNPSFKDRTVKITDPEFVRAYEIMKEFGDKIYVKGYLGSSDDDSVGLFAQEKAAMYQSGSWGPALLDPTVTKFDYKVFIIPTDFGKVTPKKIASVDNSYAISSRTKYPDLCLDLVNHMLGKEEQTWMANSQGAFPVRTDIDPAVITNLHMRDNYRLFKEHDPRGVIHFLVHSKILPPMTDIGMSLLQGTLTPEEAANRWEEAAVKAAGS